jgi:hypothetical protein
MKIILAIAAAPAVLEARTKTAASKENPANAPIADRSAVPRPAKLRSPAVATVVNWPIAQLSRLFSRGRLFCFYRQFLVGSL